MRDIERMCDKNKKLNKIWQKSHANIGAICKYFGYTTSRNILQYYAIIGCDATSFFNINGRINPFKEVLNNSNCLGLIKWLGENKSE